MVEAYTNMVVSMFKLLSTCIVAYALLWTLMQVMAPFRASILENRGDILITWAEGKSNADRRKAYKAAAWWYSRALTIYPESPHAQGNLRLLMGKP